MNPDVGILTIALKAFLDEFIAGYGRIHASAENLLHLLGLIDLGLAALFALWARNEDGCSWLAQKALTYGFWVFLVAQWITFMPTVIDGFIWVGLTAGGSTMTVKEFTNPSAIAGLGMVATEPIWNHIRSYGWSASLHLIDIIISGFLGLWILAMFFAIAIEVFVFFLQFYVFAVLATILVPFGVNRYTSWIADGCFSTLLAYGIKVMVLALITSVIFPMLHRFTVSPNPTWAKLFGMAVGITALALLCWLAPQKAVGMFTHGPQLTAGVFAASMVGAAVMTGTVSSWMGHGARSARDRIGSLIPPARALAGTTKQWRSPTDAIGGDMREELPEHFTSPVYQSLTEPLLLAGVPRNFFILNACLTFALVAYLHWWWYLPIGIGVYAGVKLITKYDPQWFGIILRALRYRDFYEV